MPLTHVQAIVSALVLAVAMDPTASAAAAPPAPKADEPYTHAQRLVDIGGRRLNLYCVGQGSPTVVFDSGLSDWSFSWALVQPSIAKMTKACVYDRAGLGYSDTAERPGASANMVDDLHLLLAAAALAPPYLLVGHSMGGLNVRLYADRHPEQVAGMVLVDPSHEDGLARIDAVSKGAESARFAADAKTWRACTAQAKKLPPAATGLPQECFEPPLPQFSAALNRARKMVQSQPSFQQAQLSEVENYLNGTSFAAVRSARRDYGHMPMIVLSSGERISSVGPEWLRLHRELAALSSAGEQKTVAGAGHYIQLDRPQAVIDAIAAVLAKLR